MVSCFHATQECGEQRNAWEHINVKATEGSNKEKSCEKIIFFS